MKMVDCEIEVNGLIEELKKVLPIEVYPTKALYLKLKHENNFKIKNKKLLKIRDVLYLGDEGGIGCSISNKKSTEVVVVSITQLRFIETHPLASKVMEYILRRTNKLAQL